MEKMLEKESVVPILKRLTIEELKSLAVNIKIVRLNLSKMSKKRMLYLLDKVDKGELIFAFQKVLKNALKIV